MHVTAIAVPYDSGHPRQRMGRGPDAFLSGGIAEALRTRGHGIDVRVVELPATFAAEPGAAFALDRQVATAVHGATAAGAFPLVLSGNCISTVGALAGVGVGDLALLWFDAHADFNTPESTVSGFLDGMALSVACGGCWTALASTIPGFAPLDPARVVLAGARDFDDGERERLEAAGGHVADVAVLSRDEGRAVLGRLRERASRLYIHLDLDVLDPKDGVANHYAVPAGLERRRLLAMLEHARATFSIAGLTLSAYDPAADPGGAVLDAGIEFASACVG
jgi:arginase